MLNDRTDMNTSLLETAESKVVDDGIERYASMASQNTQNQASFSEPPAAPSPKGTQKCPQCPKQENGPLQLKKHIDSDHGGSGNLQCSSCEFKTFSKNISLSSKKN